MTNEKPLITFALVAYNQEEFIKDAVEAALLQDYCPLEVILSDDCSTDSTFEIIKNIASVYEGPHKVVVNRNQKNIGLIEHLNQVADISRGQLIVIAAGDDISKKNRTSELVEFWLRTNKVYSFLYSKADLVSIENQKLKEIGSPPVNLTNIDYIAKHRFSFVAGATQAWDRRLLTEPNRIPAGAVAEDRFLAFRSWAKCRSLGFIDKSLVRYRLHGGNASVSEIHSLESFRIFWEKRSLSEISYLTAIIEDLRKVNCGDDQLYLISLLEKELLWSQTKARIFFMSLPNRIVSMIHAPRLSSFLKDFPVFVSISFYPALFVTIKKLRWYWRKV